MLKERHISILIAASAATLLAACGGDKDAESREETLSTVESEPVSPPPPPVSNPEIAPPGADNVSTKDRARLVKSCVEETGNSQQACECAADQAANRLDGRVYDFFSAKLAGENDRADALMHDMSMGDLRATATTLQVIFLQCQLNLPD